MSDKGVLPFSYSQWLKEKDNQGAMQMAIGEDHPCGPLFSVRSVAVDRPVRYFITNEDGEEIFYLLDRYANSVPTVGSTVFLDNAHEFEGEYLVLKVVYFPEYGDFEVLLEKDDQEGGKA